MTLKLVVHLKSLIKSARGYMNVYKQWELLKTIKICLSLLYWVDLKWWGDFFQFTKIAASIRSRLAISEMKYEIWSTEIDSTVIQ